MDSFWDFFWLMLWAFFIVIWIMILWQIFTDLFRDQEAGGFAKAIWVIALIFFTPITALIYLIAKGKGMAERNMKAAQRMQEQQAEYIRSVGGGADPSEHPVVGQNVGRARIDLEFLDLTNHVRPFCRGGNRLGRLPGAAAVG